MIRLIKTIELMSNRIIFFNIISGIVFGVLAAHVARYVTQQYDPDFKLIYLLHMNFITFFVYACLFAAIAFFAGIINIWGFKFFKPDAEIVIMWNKGAPTIEPKNVFYNKRQYICIILAPLIIIDTAIYIMFLCELVSTYSFAFVFIMNTAATANSIYISVIIMFLPNNIAIRDEGAKVQVFIPEL
jgi:hypothetical protein